MIKRKGRQLKEDVKNIRYTVRVDETDDKRMSEYCEKTGKSKSDVLREAVKKHIKESEDM